MSEDASEPSHEDNALSVERPRKRRRRALFALVIAAITLTAAWWCFGPRAMPTLPATVSTGHVDGDIWSVASTQSDAPAFFVRRETDDWDRTFVVMDEQGVILDLSLPTPAVDDQHSMLPGLGDVLTDTNGRSVFCGPNGTIVVREPDDSLQHVLLQTPAGVASIEISSECPFGHDVVWRDNQLAVFFDAIDETEDSVSWVARYDLSRTSEPQRSVTPSSFEKLPQDGFHTRFSQDGETWVRLDAANLGRSGKPSRLIFSDEKSISLPVVETSVAGTPSTGNYITFLGSANSDRFHVFRSSAEDSYIELIEMIRPGVDLEPRQPLALPTPWINQHVSKLSPDGRYVLLSKKDYRRPNLGKRYTWLRKFESHRLIEDLLLIDLIEWKIAAFYEVTTSQVGSYPKPFLLSPEFDFTGHNIIVPHQEGRFSVMDVEEWISRSSGDTPPVAKDAN